jgi:hypothetical protein
MPSGFQARSQEALANPTAAVLWAKIHPLQFACTPISVGQWKNTRTAQNVVVHYRDKVDGTAVPVNVEHRVIVRLEQ